jgi:hypothetical protein
MKNFVKILKEDGYVVAPYFSLKPGKNYVAVDTPNPVLFTLKMLHLFENSLEINDALKHTFIVPSDTWYIVVFYTLEWVKSTEG